MTYDELQKKTAELYASDEVYTSPDFQCDQTGGFPTSLCVCWEKQKAWLELIAAKTAFGFAFTPSICEAPMPPITPTRSTFFSLI